MVSSWNVKMHTLFIVVIVLLTRAASHAAYDADCNGDHCHKDPPASQEVKEEEEYPMLYWMMGDSCFKIGEYNPFLTMEQQEPPAICPEGTEMFWKDPKEWTKEEREALGLVEVDYNEYMKEAGQRVV
ncbi:uncharacterized protein LOC124277818 [Haliotis rubra]|uniref:uncharacterized protein LOC124277818 n=1 Tax=Haliotis rubra TaxID=36100 RepID=UPI001EE54742|nr:uncharacterized protein LOC124277818 [Haliotis rubra]